MEYKGNFNGADVYDDYAHHPDEVAATISSIRASMPEKRLVLAFQPHTYTRTHALFDDFIEQLKKTDVLVLAEIYAARERNTIGISSAHLAEKIPGSVWFEERTDVVDYCVEHAVPGDLIITLGCGDIYKEAKLMVERYREKAEETAE